MRLNKHSLNSVFLLTAMSVIPFASFAEGGFLPQPKTTVASSNVSAVEEIGVPQKVRIQHTTPAVIKPAAVVELVSKFISKQTAITYAKDKQYQIYPTYSVSGGKVVKIDALPSSLFFYLNRKTHRIGIAINKTAAKAVSISAARVYSAKEGETLKTTLSRWAKRSGYHLEWLSDYDYNLSYSYEFVGRLTNAFGPINQALTSISDSNYALKAVVTRNNVILIKDNDFSPSVLSR